MNHELSHLKKKNWILLPSLKTDYLEGGDDAMQNYNVDCHISPGMSELLEEAGRCQGPVCRGETGCWYHGRTVMHPNQAKPQW